MTLVVHFTVPGPPRGQQRTGKGQFGARYKDAKTKLYENRIAMAAEEAMAGRPLLDCAVSLSMVAYMMIPKSASKKRQAAMLAGEIRPTIKPDWDNIGKTSDALKGIVWRDDTQVVHATVSKWYAATPRLDVAISEVLP